MEAPRSNLIKTETAGRKLFFDCLVERGGGRRVGDKAARRSRNMLREETAQGTRDLVSSALHSPQTAWRTGSFPEALRENKSTSTRFLGKDSVCVLQLICSGPTAGHEIDRKWHKCTKQKQRRWKLLQLAGTFLSDARQLQLQGTPCASTAEAQHNTLSLLMRLVVPWTRRAACKKVAFAKVMRFCFDYTGGACSSAVFPPTDLTHGGAAAAQQGSLRAQS